MMREFYGNGWRVDIGESLRRAKLRMIESFGPEALPKLGVVCLLTAMHQRLSCRMGPPLMEGTSDLLTDSSVAPS